MKENDLFNKIKNAVASTTGCKVSDADVALIIYIYESEKNLLDEVINGKTN